MSTEALSFPTTRPVHNQTPSSDALNRPQSAVVPAIRPQSEASAELRRLRRSILSATNTAGMLCQEAVTVLQVELARQAIALLRTALFHYTQAANEDWSPDRIAHEMLTTRRAHRLIRKLQEVGHRCILRAWSAQDRMRSTQPSIAGTPARTQLAQEAAAFAASLTILLADAGHTEQVPAALRAATLAIPAGHLFATGHALHMLAHTKGV